VNKREDVEWCVRRTLFILGVIAIQTVRAEIIMKQWLFMKISPSISDFLFKDWRDYLTILIRSLLA